MCPFVEKKKKKALCLVLHISTKKRPTLFFQPLPTPLLLIIITMSNPSYCSGLESNDRLWCNINIWGKKLLTFTAVNNSVMMPKLEELKPLGQAGWTLEMQKNWSIKTNFERFRKTKQLIDNWIFKIVKQVFWYLC